MIASKKNSPTLEFDVVRENRRISISFQVERMVNVAYAGRNQKAVQAHIDELEKEGVAPPASVPAIFPIPSRVLTRDPRIEVVESKTSGEAEFVLLLQDDQIYVGVGSDHTDRRLEASSILNSKLVCPNVVSRELWDYQDIKSHWDEIILQSWTKPSANLEEVTYQKASLSALLPVSEMLRFVKAKFSDQHLNGLVIFSGTVPILPEHVIYGTCFRCELIDPRLARSLECKYEIEKLDYLENEFCAPKSAANPCSSEYAVG
jgi:hypothetical protein